MRLKMTAVALIGLLGAASLTGCAGTVTDQHGDQHPKGVVYYDKTGQFHEATPEAISPKAQDRWETAGWLIAVPAALGGLATSIVTATN